jgi:biopolymer transport protein ExbB
MTPAEPVEFSVLSNGGPLIWPMFALSVLATVFIIERGLFLHRGRIRAADFVEGLRNNLRKGRLVEALTVCEQSPGPVPRVIKATLLHSRDGEARMRAAAEEAALLEIPVLERRLGAIGAIAKVAPLLGFLATLIALLRAFLQLKSAGHYANADLFAGDIAGAIVTSAAGLGLAAMAHLGAHFLHGRVRALTHDIEWAAIAMIRFICHELPAENEDRTVEAGDEVAARP